MDALKGVTREIRHAVLEMHGNETETASGSTTDVDAPSGTATPHPDAYEACINNVMTKKQQQAERRASATAKHPDSIRFAQSTDQPSSASVGAKSYSDALLTDPKSGQIHHPGPSASDEPSANTVLKSSSDHIPTPLDEQGYEGNLRDAMDTQQKELDRTLGPDGVVAGSTDDKDKDKGRKKKKKGRKA